VSRKEFMEELQILLGELPAEEREEALRYYESYFEEAGVDQEQVVLDELGSAGRIAAQILRDYRMENGGEMYTEQGYTEDYDKQTPVKYAGGTQKEAQEGSGITITKKGMRIMKLKDDVEKIKKKQVEEIKDCITKLVNKYSDYYKDKDYAKKIKNY